MSTRPNRETAYRIFAAEFDDASLSYAESDEERAPNYVLTPTGARINRLFAVGVLTEIESVNDEQLRARIVDPTGAFVVYAGQYQPEALSFLERAAPPAFVAVTGKARTFQPEDSNRVFTSIRPETLSEVDATTRDRFTVDAAERTTERVRTMTEALERDERGDALRDALENEGVEGGLAAGIPRALAHYGTTQTYLDAVQEMSLDAARVVAGEREEVGSLGVAPGEGESADRTALADTDETDAEAEPAASATEPTDETKTESMAETVDDGATVSVDSQSDVESESTVDSDASAVETESPVEAESPRETDEPTADEPTTAESPVEPEQSGTETEDEDIAGDPLERIDESADETTESGVNDEEADDTSIETDLDDPEEFELDDDERERIEAEYGTDFESAAEVDGPGEAGIETPPPEEPGEEPEPSETAGAETTEPSEEIEPTAGEASTTETVETDTTDDTETTEHVDTSADEPDVATEPDENESAGDETETDLDPEEAVVTAMRELDDGDGADREEVIQRVIEGGLTREAATEGIQSALMSGECYEPDDDTLKPI